MTTFIQETIAGEVVPSITLIQAQEITQKLRNEYGKVEELVVSAYANRIWLVMGYRSWDEYIDGEFKDLAVTPPKDQRARTIAAYSEAGMSTRAISAVTGLSKSSVNREVKKAREEGLTESDTPVRGLDGKVRKASVAPAVELSDDILDAPVDDYGISGFSTSKKAESPVATAKKVETPAVKNPVLQEVIERAADFEKASIKAMEANGRERFDTKDVPEALVLSTSRALLVASGLLQLMNLQPDLFDAREGTVEHLESAVVTLDAVLDSLKGEDDDKQS